MRRGNFLPLWALLLLLLPQSHGRSPAPMDTPELEESRQLVTSVRKAASLVRKKGDSACGEFRNPEGQWRRDDFHIFVLDIQGKMICNPEHPKDEGKNLIHLKDLVGRTFIQLSIDAVMERKWHGWVHYLWPRPSDGAPSWKSSFVVRTTAPRGKRRVVGAAIYDAKPDRAFAADLVDQAAVLLRRKGRPALRTLRNPNGPYRVASTFVMVFDGGGKVLVSAESPELEGQSLIEDPERKDLAGQALNELKEKKAVWITHEWPSSEPAQKRRRSFIRKVETDGETFYVTAGLSTLAPESGRQPTQE